MNRRNYLKFSLFAGLAGAASFTLFKFNTGEIFTVGSLHDHKALIIALAERIIPETDTPGAKRAGVCNYIMNVLINCTDQKQQDRFLTGLKDVDFYSLEKYGTPFVNCSDDNQDLILAYFERKAGYGYTTLDKIHNKLFGKEFYTKFRELTIEGYCLSKAGATRGLAYEHVPGIYEACLPIKAHQKSWATK